MNEIKLNFDKMGKGNEEFNINKAASEGQLPKEKALGNSPQSNSDSGPHILLVDDTKFNNEILSKMLTKLGLSSD